MDQQLDEDRRVLGLQGLTLSPTADAGGAGGQGGRAVGERASYPPMSPSFLVGVGVDRDRLACLERLSPISRQQGEGEGAGADRRQRTRAWDSTPAPSHR